MHLPPVWAALGSLFLAVPALAAPSHTESYLRRRALLGSNFGVPTLNATYDYVIVGGGNAGLTIASRLSESQKSVAVVEGGSFYEITNGNLSEIPADDIFFTGRSQTDFNPLVDWGFNTVPQPALNGIAPHYARGKTLGGSTARNYMVYTRGSAGSYKMWADAVGDQSYNFQNFLPWFQKSLKFTPPNNAMRGQNATPSYDAASLGTSGPLSVSFPNWAEPFDTYLQHGLPEIGVPAVNGFTSGNLLGSSWPLTTINQTTGTRDSSETSFLRRALGRPNFYVYPDSIATKILFNGTTATGVVVNTEGSTYTLTANKEVILSAGVFQSPQLLMVSGIGPKATLDKYNIPVIADKPGVGQDMWDHVLFGLSYRVNVVTNSILGVPSAAAAAAAEFNKNGGGILSNPGSDLIGVEKVPQNLRANFSKTTNQQLSQFPADWPEIVFLGAGGFFGATDNIVQGQPRDAYQYSSIAMAVIAPTSRGNVTISSANALDKPVINPQWLTTESDQQVAVAAFKRARAAYTSPSVHNITIGEEYFPGPQVQTDDQILAFIKQRFGLLYHATSTAKMGNDTDPMAVVDTRCRVRGAKNLRVVDASAFPLLPPGFPMSTVYALAEKIADDILKS